SRIKNSDNYNLNVLDLSFNVGYQSAIYSGLEFIHQNIEVQKIIVIDGDGEDDVSMFPNLLESSKEYDIVLVVRGNRNEGWFFKVLYFLYKKLSKAIIGLEFNFGNYSIINASLLDSILSNEFIHYASMLSRVRCKKKFIKSDKAERIAGVSKMNIDSLILHGLKSWVVYADKLVLFFFKLSIVLFGSIVLLVTGVMALKLTNNATAGWASNLIASLFNSFLICFGFVVMGLLGLKKS
ncbi:MAG: hypothetical protein ACJA1A_003931, partial [Saprospiraceae bacterium]